MHIFISYAKNDTRQLTKELASQLESLPNITVWWDQTLRAGDSWAAQIQDEIKRCDLFIVLLSPDVNRSRTGKHGGSFVLKEINYAQNLDKTILPVMAQTTELPVQIADLQYIDLTQNQRQGLADLLAEVGHMAGLADDQTPTPAYSSPAPTQRKWRLWAGLGALILVLLSMGIIFALSGDGDNKDDTKTPRPTTAVAQQSPTDLSEASSTPSTNTQVATNTDTPPATSVSEDPTITPVPTNPGIINNDDWKPATLEIAYDDFTVSMVLVPAGCFMMGDDEHDYDEQPATLICFDEPFWLDQYEVSQAQFMALAGQADHLNFYENDSDNLPREQVTWDEAFAFCSENRSARLPTEAEWEYAGRGPDNLIYPWGNEFDGTRSNLCDVNCDFSYSNNDISDGFALLAPVGSYPEGRSWVNAYDLTGNISEWTSTIYDYYPYDANDGRENLADNLEDQDHVIRGDDWTGLSANARLTYRTPFPADYFDRSIGFRCARDYETSSQTETNNQPAIELLSASDNTCSVTEGYSQLMRFGAKFYNTTTENSRRIRLFDADDNMLVEITQEGQNTNGQQDWGWYPPIYEVPAETELTLEITLYENEAVTSSAISTSTLTYNCTTGEVLDKTFNPIAE